MLDVHAPEHPLTTKREFFLHLFTITIGLLIALGLENAAEWAHHQHQRREADANIVSELRDNEKNLDNVLKHVPDERTNLLNALKFLNAHIAGRTTDIHDLSLGLSLGSLRDASFQTANANGALSYMDYEHVKRYSAAYTLQSQFNELQHETLTAYLTMQSNIIGGDDPEKLAKEDAQRAKEQVQQTLARIVAVDQIGHALRQTYEKALSEK